MKNIHPRVYFLLFFLAFFLSSKNGYAQNYLIPNDSILNEVRALLQSNPREAYNKTLEIVSQNNAFTQNQFLAETYFLQGRAASYLGDFDIALLAQFDALAFCPTENEALRANIFM